MSLIVIVSGERDWEDRQQVDERLSRLALASSHTGFIIGDCPTGVDAYAWDWCKRNGVPYIRKVASGAWPEAGPRRNAAMVQEAVVRMGPDVRVRFNGFWSGKRQRSGTLDCMEQSVRAGISGYVTARGVR